MTSPRTFGRTTNTDQYGFVVFPGDPITRMPVQDIQHHRWDPKLCHGVWTFELTTHSPLLIHAGMDGNGFPKDVGVSDTEGPGKKKPIPKSFLKSKHPDHLGQPVIPGSSLKGMIRSVYEIITHSCGFQIRNEYPHEPPNLDRSVPARACIDSNALCPSCRLFGWMSHKATNSDVCFQGRVSIGDALPPSGRPVKLSRSKWLPILGSPVPKDRSTSTLFHSYYQSVGSKKMMRGRKRYQAWIKANSGQEVRSQSDLAKMSTKPAESVTESQTFRLQVHFHNLTQAERGVLMRCFLLETGQHHLLGSAKAHGWGQVSLQLTAWRSLNPQDRYRGGRGWQDEFPHWRTLHQSDMALAVAVTPGKPPLYHEEAAQGLAQFQTHSQTASQRSGDPCDA